MFRLILSVIIGYILGKERKRHEKEGGGSRTLAIISLASCLIAILTLEIANKIHPEIHNFSRLMAYGIASIGFLGSSVIIKNKCSIEGTTTASLIWAIVPINYMIGLGYFFYGLISTLIVYLILESKYFLKNERKK